MVVAQYLLTFREVLEAALLTAIIMSYLAMTGRMALRRYAWYGVFAAIALSFVLGVVIWVLFGSLTQAQQVLFEGVAALIAVSVLTSVIYWMAIRSRSIKSKIEGRVEAAVTHGAVLGLASVTFILVFREGLETVLFLTPFMIQDVSLTLLGAILGVGAGLGLAYAIFRFGVHLDVRRFFYFTSVLLILLAGGLLGYAIHELFEYGVLRGVDFGFWGEAAYVLPISSESLLHHKNIVGSIFAVMFGYTVRPEWARLIAHAAYLVIALPLVVFIYRRPDVVAALGARLRNFTRSSPLRGKSTQED